ncbi:hypothetical protein GQ55_1G287800 [Panicum hallii var. hallii]|uniref:Uncharacterized protein n=1 Tax=Panicum hallii var. hallii TaxID=1504633 RepID=A0A2T7F8J6_9POAL|nr:hypothetical protein GQ55_1G287800 [Panicum hallii var. hallii]
MVALRRAAPVPGARPFSKPSRGAAPPAAACGAMARESSSSIRRAGANRKLSVPSTKCTKVVRNGVVVGMEATPVGGGEAPSAHPIGKRPRIVETATCAAVAKEKKSSARRAGADEQFSVPSPKRAKVTRDGVETSVAPAALGTLRKRMAAELDALHALLRKAEPLSSGKSAEPRSEAPVEASINTPPAKRTKVYDLAMVAKLESPEDDNEFIDICGGKAGETGNSESKDIPEDDNEFVDICGGVSPVVPVEKACESGSSPTSSRDSGSSSSSDSDSDSDSENDRNETVDLPVPQAVLPEENGTSVQPAPDPASKMVAQSTEPEKLPTAALIAKAKVRRNLLEMERAVLPDESIHPRDLNDLYIAEYGRPGIMRQLGLFLKADA